MNIECCSFGEMAENILQNNKKIIMFGAGVIGQITTPELLIRHKVLEYLDCYLDNDLKKWGDFIEIANNRYIIRSPEYLKQCDENTVILINI